MKQGENMKVIVERAALLRAMSHAASVVERRNTIPILANVLLKAEGDSLRLTATDLNIQFTQSIAAQVAAEGAVTVDVQLLHSIAREVADGSQITLEVGESRLNVTAGRSRFKLNTLAASDFPVIAQPAGSARFRLLPAQLRGMLAKVAFAQSDEIARPYLNGIRLETLNGELVAAATNGNVLAMAATPAPEGASEAPDVILSSKFVAELRKLLDGIDREVEVELDSQRALVRVGEAELSGKLVDGTYPDFRRVIPAQNDKKLEIHTDAFASAVKRSALVAMDKTRAVKLELSRDKLTVSSASPEFGLGSEEAPAVYEADELAVGFQSRFLLDTFAAIGAPEIRVDFADAGAPTLFTNPADDSARWVVMPCRV